MREKIKDVSEQSAVSPSWSNRDRLKVALMGLTGIGGEYLSAILADNQFDLIAAADHHSDGQRRGKELGISIYEDYRSLILETARSGLDVLFVAVEPFRAIEHVELAASKGVSVYHQAPFARSVAEGRRLADRFRDDDCLLVASRPWRFDPAFARLNRLQENIGRVCAAWASVAAVDTPEGWRGDRERAGGGVLLYGAYEVVDLLVDRLGLPESVHALSGMRIPPDAPRRYDTEDMIALSLDFGSGRLGAVTAVRGVSAGSWRVRWIGTEAIMDIGCDGLTVVPRDELGSPEHAAPSAGYSSAQDISTFGTSRRTRTPTMASTIEQHLPTLAVIEAAYLSTKTNEPESPRQFLE